MSIKECHCSSTAKNIATSTHYKQQMRQYEENIAKLQEEVKKTMEDKERTGINWRSSERRAELAPDIPRGEEEDEVNAVSVQSSKSARYKPTYYELLSNWQQAGQPYHT